MRAEPMTPQRLVALLVEHIEAIQTPHPVRILLDGPAPARPAELADALTEPLRVLGRPVLRVSAGDFLRPASLRLEHGRRDPDAYYESWLDTAALRREVLDPLGPDGSRQYLPSLWNAHTDRATRAPYRTAAPGAVLAVDGALLLGQGLPAELSVHLDVSPTVLRRRLDPDRQWTLPAFDRYAAEVDPWLTADLVVRCDDPAHPALLRQR
ncbi:MAG: uridine kinase [Actinocatenispora sp.]